MGFILVSGRTSLLRRLLSSSIALFTLAFHAGSAAESIRHLSGFPPGLREYGNELIHLALKRTSEQYGDFDYKFITRQTSKKRMLVEINRSGLFNVAIHTSPIKTEQFPDIEIVSLPAKRKITGLRSLIIRSDQAQAFKNIDTAKALKSLVLCLPEVWVDVAILKNSGLNVQSVSSFDVMFPMLWNRRFDYIPLSFFESGATLKELSQSHPGLMEAENIFLYYPLHLDVLISKKDGKLSERLRKGLEIIIQNGEEEALFTRLFGAKLKQLKNPDAKVFVLKNLYFSTEENLKIIEKFLLHYDLADRTIFLPEVSRGKVP